MSLTPSCWKQSAGIRAKPAGLMTKLRQVKNTYHAVKRYEQDGKKAGEMAKWKRENEELWNIVQDIEKLRETYG